MRRYIRRKIDVYLDKIEQLHLELPVSINSGRSDTVREILEKCQEFAICAGEAIETEKRINHLLIENLEEYCELVYQQSLKVEEMQKFVDGCGQLNGKIEQIRKSLSKTEGEDTLEIVFLPYKASMWDSLESVWQAAIEDKACECFVIPLPYYDKKADKSFGEMHWEGNDFPDYVPVTRWDMYDMEKRHPDIIYIHNPYDGMNNMTCIHPDYFAKELKKYTDMLVYIPYFVCSAEVQEHFCVLPGTLYADRVILQSEEVREEYIRYFHKFERENNCIGLFGNAEEKFLALGSPKFDKVRATTRENISIPREWLQKIRKEDGTWKKIILYNTSITGLLEGNEKALRKIESVLKLFHEREDFVLLWRPHPLSRIACQAMRPQLMEEYNQVIEEYRKGNWGIFDDTPEVERAIALSDAYYGDQSSLVAMYEITGKPIMIQNVEVIE